MKRPKLKDKMFKPVLDDKEIERDDHNKALEKLAKLVDDTNKKGGKMRFTGERSKDGGFILRPTFDI